MQRVLTAQEIRQHVARVKSVGNGFATNLFFDDAALEEAIAAEELFLRVYPETLVVLKRQPLFDRIYFACADSRCLSVALAEIPISQVGGLIADVVGTAQDVSAVVDQFLSVGFKSLAEFRTMQRVGPCKFSPELPHVAELASKEDSEQVWRAICAHFDPYSEHLPLQREVESAIASGSVLVTRSDGHPAAILWYDRKGATSTLRYWLVSPKFRGRGLGEQVMARYFRECADVRRFKLWVRSSNIRAIQHYQRYGYEFASPSDFVLRRS